MSNCIFSTFIMQYFYFYFYVSKIMMKYLSDKSFKSMYKIVCLLIRIIFTYFYAIFFENIWMFKLFYVLFLIIHLTTEANQTFTLESLLITRNSPVELSLFGHYFLLLE